MFSHFTDDTLTAIAKRKGLGLNVTELAEVELVSQSNRTIANYERRAYPISSSYAESLDTLSMYYKELLTMLERDIEDYNRLVIEHKPPLVLPYYEGLADFQEVFNKGTVTKWRLWQSVLGHLLLTNKISGINDSLEIPHTFINTKNWLAQY